jgi:hypothetical protein
MKFFWAKLEPIKTSGVNAFSLVALQQLSRDTHLRPSSLPRDRLTFGEVGMNEGTKQAMGETRHDQLQFLEEYRSELTRVRVQLAELKRTGSRQGLTDLTADAGRLSMRIRLLETVAKTDEVAPVS